MKILLNIGIISGGLVWLWLIAENPPWYGIFIVLLLGAVIPQLLFSSEKKTTSKGNIHQNTEKNEDAQASTEVKKKELNDEEIIAADLNDLNGYEFERLIAMYYNEKGYRTQIIGGSGGHEVDIILTDPNDNMKIAVQCKHWKTKNVENDTILRLSAGKRNYKCLDAWCITTSKYTKSAEEAAAGLNIELLDGHHVQDFIENWQKRKRMLANRRKKTMV